MTLKQPRGLEEGRDGKERMLTRTARNKIKTTLRQTFTKQTEGVLETIELLVRKKKGSSPYQDISRKKRQRDERPIQPQMKKNSL